MDIDAIEKDLELIDDMDVEPKVDANTKQAETKINQLEKALDFLDSKSVRTAIDLNDRLFVTKFQKTKKSWIDLMVERLKLLFK